MKWMEGKKTLSGVYTSLIGALLQIFGMDEATTSELTNQIVDLVSILMVVVGTIVGHWGRIVAKGPLK